MHYVVLGSSRGLGEYIVRRANADYGDGFVSGLDISPSSLTHYLVDFTNLKKLQITLESIINSKKGPFCFVYTAIPVSRTRKNKDLLKYVDDASHLLSLGFNALLIVAHVLHSYTNQLLSNSVKLQKNYIINIGSVLSERVSFAESPAYGASKAATHELIKYLSLHLMPNFINCFTITPSIMPRNKDSENFLRSRLDRYDELVPLVSYGEVYDAILAITSDLLSAMRGSNLILDHGLEHFEAFHLIDNTQKQTD